MENVTTSVAIALYELPDDPNNYHWALVLSPNSTFHPVDIYQITNQNGPWATYHRVETNLLSSTTFLGIVRVSTCSHSLAQLNQYITRSFGPARPMGYGQGSNDWTCAHWVMNVLQNMSDPTRPALNHPVALDSWALYSQVKASGNRLRNFERYGELVSVSSDGLKQVDLARNWETEW
jgi:hypothetical protein